MTSLPDDIHKDIYELTTYNVGQLSYKEYEIIAKTLLDMSCCNFLSFSTGKDVPLWLKINNSGKNVFLEHDNYWVTKTKELCPSAIVHKVTYNTMIKNAVHYYTDPRSLTIVNLPGYIRDTDWDIIFIDGPTGYNSECPGRFQSIWEASKFNAKHVFIHDIDRTVEKTCANLFFSSYEKRTQIDRMLYLCQ